MRIKTPEEKAIEAINTKSDRGFDSLTEVVLPDPELVKSPVEDVSDAEYTRGLNSFLQSQLELQVEESIPLVREEALAALAKNPDDERAQANLLWVAQWERKQHLPPEKRGSSIIVTKPRKVGSRKVGLFRNTKEFGWVVEIRGCQIGEVVEVRKRGGLFQKVKLLGRVGDSPNHYKVQNIGGEK